jgi:hypothetical protein
MAGSKSNYLSKALLDHMLGGWGATGPTGATAPTGPGALLPYVYVGLWTTAGSLTDASDGEQANEVSTSATGYTRVEVDNNSTNWPASSGSTTGIKQNGTAITFPTATASWGSIYQFALLDSVTAAGSNVLFWGDLTSVKVIGNGDTASFSAGALSITED